MARGGAHTLSVLVGVATSADQLPLLHGIHVFSSMIIASGLFRSLYGFSLAHYCCLGCFWHLHFRVVLHGLFLRDWPLPSPPYEVLYCFHCCKALFSLSDFLVWSLRCALLVHIYIYYMVDNI